MRFATVCLLCLSLLVGGCLNKASTEKASTEKKETEAQHHGLPEDMSEDLKNLAATPGATVTTEKHLMFGSKDDDPKTHGWNEEARKHFAQFVTQLPKDSNAARLSLTKVAEVRFGEHPLNSKWVESCLDVSSGKEVSILKVKRFLELELQLLTETDPIAYTKGIQATKGALSHFDILITTMKNSGQDPDKVYVNPTVKKH